MAERRLSQVVVCPDHIRHRLTPGCPPVHGGPGLGGYTVAEVGAFSLGGWIAQLFSAITVATVDAMTFFASALMLVWIRTPEPAPARSDEQSSLRSEIVAGLQQVVSNPILRAIGASNAFAAGLGGGIIGALIVLYGIDTLGFAPGVLGTIFAIGGATSVLGALSTGRLTRQFGLGKTLVTGFLLYSLASFLIPLARGPLLLAGAFLVVQQLFDFGLAVYEINEVSLRQTITSERMLGRVNASLEVVEIGRITAGGRASRGRGPTMGTGCGGWLDGGGWAVASAVPGSARRVRLSQRSDYLSIAPVHKPGRPNETNQMVLVARLLRALGSLGGATRLDESGEKRDPDCGWPSLSARAFSPSANCSKESERSGIERPMMGSSKPLNSSRKENSVVPSSRAVSLNVRSPLNSPNGMPLAHTILSSGTNSVTVTGNVRSGLSLVNTLSFSSGAIWPSILTIPGSQSG
ncbi:MAG: hypothetical protein CL878_01980 [Dehalococcoidia bacterium]|nr:hypothetical protein [Dehalococcoidia bacterium]